MAKSNRDDITRFGFSGSGNSSQSKEWQLLKIAGVGEDYSNIINFDEDIDTYKEIMFVSKVWSGEEVFHASAIYPTSLLVSFIGTNSVVCVSNDARTAWFRINSKKQITNVNNDAPWEYIYVK